jgi:hypothetical protein
MITLVLPEEQVDRLEQSARRRNKSLAELLKVRLIDLFEDPADPFDPRGQRLREVDQELLRRIT